MPRHFVERDGLAADAQKGPGPLFTQSSLHRLSAAWSRRRRYSWSPPGLGCPLIPVPGVDMMFGILIRTYPGYCVLCAIRSLVDIILSREGPSSRGHAPSLAA